MKTITLLVLFLGLTNATSWFGSSSEPEPYKKWSNAELKSWLEAHDIPIPTNENELRTLVDKNWNTVSVWSYDQYASAQKAFNDIRDSSFEKWDDSRLRQFLLDQGIVAPKGPREHLIHLAQSHYRAYTNAASSFSAHASTAIYGDSTHQATQSLSSLAAQATDSLVRALDDSKDYVYSTWDDNKLRIYLESKGALAKDQAQKSRADLLRMMHDAYAKVTDPVWKAWSDSYIHVWLVAHNIISPTPPSPYSREYLLNKMSQYYYDVNDTVYSTWSESQLKAWLVEHGIIKSDAQITREKMLRLVSDNYLSTKSTLFAAWSDSQLRDYLAEHGYIDDRSAVQIKRDELVKIMKEKYTVATTPSYLAWPDARLRAYLRQHGISEDQLPTARPGLLQETRIRWVQTRSNAEMLWAKVRDIVGGVEEGVEDQLARVWAVLKGEGHKYASYADDKYTEAEVEYEKGKERAYEKSQDARTRAGKKVKTAGEKIEGEL